MRSIATSIISVGVRRSREKNDLSVTSEGLFNSESVPFRARLKVSIVPVDPRVWRRQPRWMEYQSHRRRQESVINNCAACRSTWDRTTIRGGCQIRYGRRILEGCEEDVCFWRRWIQCQSCHSDIIMSCTRTPSCIPII